MCGLVEAFSNSSVVRASSHVKEVQVNRMITQCELLHPIVNSYRWYVLGHKFAVTEPMRHTVSLIEMAASLNCKQQSLVPHRSHACVHSADSLTA